MPDHFEDFELANVGQYLTDVGDENRPPFPTPHAFAMIVQFHSDQLREYDQELATGEGPGTQSDGEADPDLRSGSRQTHS